LLHLYLKGKDIAIKLNKERPTLSRWNKNRILYILRNETYTGTFVWNRNSSVNDNEVIRVKGSHPAIISEEDFLKIPKMIYSRRPRITNPRVLRTENILNGLIYCSRCNKAFSSNSAQSGDFHYYLCSTKSKSGKSQCSQRALKDFTRILSMGSIFEQKSFIRSFIKRIWIDYPTATIEYTVPINKGKGQDNGKKEVLALAKNALPICLCA
jgi:hypothetical protein